MQSGSQRITPFELATRHGRGVCRILNCRFVGIQQGFGIRPDQILFQPLTGPASKTTLAIDVFCTPESMAWKIIAAHNAFALDLQEAA